MLLFFDSLTAIGNVSFPLREFTDWPEDKIEKHSLELLALVGLDENSAKKLPAHLSGGMRKRVGLARALVFKAKNYVL